MGTCESEIPLFGRSHQLAVPKTHINLRMNENVVNVFNCLFAFAVN